MLSLERLHTGNQFFNNYFSSFFPLAVLPGDQGLQRQNPLHLCCCCRSCPPPASYVCVCCLFFVCVCVCVCVFCVCVCVCVCVCLLLCLCLCLCLCDIFKHASATLGSTYVVKYFVKYGHRGTEGSAGAGGWVGGCSTRARRLDQCRQGGCALMGN